MKLMERIVLLQITSPMTGTFDQIKAKQVINKELSLSDEELKLVNYRQEGDVFVWDTDKDPDKEIVLTKEIKELVGVALDQYKAKLEDESKWSDMELARVELVEGLIKDEKK